MTPRYENPELLATPATWSHFVCRAVRWVGTDDTAAQRSVSAAGLRRGPGPAARAALPGRFRSVGKVLTNAVNRPLANVSGPRTGPKTEATTSFGLTDAALSRSTQRNSRAWRAHRDVGSPRVAPGARIVGPNPRMRIRSERDR